MSRGDAGSSFRGPPGDRRDGKGRKPAGQLTRRISGIRRSVAATLAFLIPVAGATAAERAGLFGEPLARSAALQAGLSAAGFEVTVLDAAQLTRLDTLPSTVALLGPEGAVPPECRPAVDRFLAAGGVLLVVGAETFDYSPRALGPVPAVDLRDTRAFEILQPKAARDGWETALVEPARVSPVTTPAGRPALHFRTVRRGMSDLQLRFPVAAVRAPQRTVLRFAARGDAYSDLLALEITDRAGGNWLTLVPLAPEWRTYDVSLADFLPRGWKEGGAVPPRLDPAAIETVALGIDDATVWREKPTAFAVGEIALAAESTGRYAPTAALGTLRVPLHANQMSAPVWLFDPLRGARKVSPPPGYSQAVECPPPLVQHPGVAMGTDHRPPFATLAAREQRREPLLRGAEGQVVAEARYLAAGRHDGARLGLFGVPAADLVSRPEGVALLVQTAATLARRVAVVSAHLNTTARTGTVAAQPLLRVKVHNPRPSPQRGRVEVEAAGGRLRGAVALALPARGAAEASVPLGEVPADFPFAGFDWRVTFIAEDGTSDSLTDTADVERALLRALGHLVRTQRQFPDGRISHHYFGDAYGVRGLFAYLDLVRREPERLRRNADLWADTGPAELRAAGERFVDMLLARQNADGSIPMGYGEQSDTYNVADGGQIALSLGQIAPLLDPGRRAACFRFCRRFAGWAETFYLDEARAAELAARTEPAKRSQARAGHYGLGSSRGVRQPLGPSWVLPDILGVQLLLTYVDSAPELRRIADRNVRAYLDAGYGAAGYYHAEALLWAWRDAVDPGLRARLAETVTRTFVPPLLAGKPDDLFDFGARGTLRALPLQYYRRYIADTPEARAVLLKYVWTFASESSERSLRRQVEAHPKPHHGESIAASKYAAFSAVWAAELVAPESTFLRWPGFPRHGKR